MIKTCRIWVRQNGNMSMEECLDIQLKQAGIKLEDISINVHPEVSWKQSDNSHFGNWCFVPCRDIPELHNEIFEPDLFAFVLEQSDIDVLKVGDKVRIQYTNSWAAQNQEQGTVNQIKGDEIIVLKKGSKSKGWKFHVLDSCMIEKVEKWSK